MIPPFAPILESALSRLGKAELKRRLPQPRTPAELRALPDDRYLSLIALRVFRAGLKHSVVDAKWPGFENAFHGFDPRRVRAMSDEATEALMKDARLIRHWGKLKSVRANAAAVLDIAAEHGSFGAFIADWPGDDIVGLWEALGKRLQQLGGNSAPVFLRMAGKDTFVPTDYVAKALAHWGAFPGPIKSKKDRIAVQAVFNAWSDETKRPLCELSMIAAASVD